MNITKFDPDNASPSHEGTILASDVLPKEMSAPFEHAYGCLFRGQSMMGHAHSNDEFYLVISGSGQVIVGGKNLAVKAGDAIAIPPDTFHTMICTEKDEAPLIWAAFWWTHMEGGVPFTDEIAVQTFKVENGTSENGDPKLADYIVPPQLKTPFGHAYGYLTKGNAMIPHKHHEDEIYIMLKGQALMTIGEESRLLDSGDVVAIPPDVLHTLEAETDEFLWAAIWWDIS